MTIRDLCRPATVSLRRLLPVASFVGCGDVRVRDATDESGACVPGTLFAAVRGGRHDGLMFVDEALQRGAGALLVPRALPKAKVPQCVVPDVRWAYARVCQCIAGEPSRRLKLVGVTGTNGKTTVSWLLRSILQAMGLSTGLLGTIEYDDGGYTQQAELTTPGPRALSTWLASMVSRGTTHATMELSSHALDQDRAAGVELEAAVITNITQDHFDYHGDAASYMSAKSRILGMCRSTGCVVWNAEDQSVSKLVDAANGLGRQVSFAIAADADVRAEIVSESAEGTRFVVRPSGGQALKMVTPLVGRHNILNILAAMIVAEHLGADRDSIVAGIARLGSIPGRMEAVRCGQPFDVFVDYAHTDDALRRALVELQGVTKGRVICVFGAGGDRDRSKRPLLGAAAATADVCIVTSDNPRSEDPRRILAEVSSGVEDAGGQPLVEEDRRVAIDRALNLARAGDCVLVAGKGHETHQTVGGRRLRFDDREVVRAALSRHPWQSRKAEKQ